MSEKDQGYYMKRAFHIEDESQRKISEQHKLEILEQLRFIHAELVRTGKPADYVLTGPDIDTASKNGYCPPLSAIISVFSKPGINYILKRAELPAKIDAAPHREWNRQQIKDWIVEFYKANGKVPKAGDYDEAAATGQGPGLKQVKVFFSNLPLLYRGLNLIKQQRR